MWTNDAIKTFYADYADRYDTEIDKAPHSYPAPDKLATWLLSHLEHLGTLKRPLRKTTSAADSAVELDDDKLCHPTTNHTDERAHERNREDRELSDVDFPYQLLASLPSSPHDSSPSPPPDHHPSGVIDPDQRTATDSDDAEVSTVEILDLGCGTGKSSRLFFEHPMGAECLRLTGVDATPEMLEKARAFPFHHLHCQNIELPLNLPSSSYDVVMCVGVMDFIAQPRQLLAQIVRVLKPHGLLSVTLPEKSTKSQKPESQSENEAGKNEDECRKEEQEEEPREGGLTAFDQSEAKTLIREAGFTILRHERFLGYVDSVDGTEMFYFGYLLTKA